MSKVARPPWITRSLRRNTDGTGNNAPADDIGPDFFTRHFSASAYNLIGTGGAGGLTNGINGNLVGVATPGLGDLANNGGPTQTIAVLSGSPAIDAGNTALAVDAHGSPLTTDRRGPGFPRVVNETIDIGAFEVGDANLYIVDLTSARGASTSTNAGDLVYVIDQANANQNPAGSVIEFDPIVFANPQTIYLSSTFGALTLAEEAGPETIDGPGANLVTIVGGTGSAVFLIGTVTATSWA